MELGNSGTVGSREDGWMDGGWMDGWGMAPVEFPGRSPIPRGKDLGI